MNKKIMTLAVLTLFVAQTNGSASLLFAAEDPLKVQQEQLAKKKAELNGHEWEINLTKSGTKEPVKDVLTFKDMMFESKSTTSQGYKPTNYTITLQEGGPTIFETMQSNEKNQPVFWRGEWEGESMHGMMSKQLGEGKNEDYYFSSVSSKVVADTPKEEKKPEVPAADQAAAVVDAAKAQAPAPADAEKVVEAAKVEAKEAVAEVKAAAKEDVKAVKEVKAAKVQETKAAAKAEKKAAKTEKNKKKWLF